MTNDQEQTTTKEKYTFLKNKLTNPLKLR